MMTTAQDTYHHQSVIRRVKYVVFHPWEVCYQAEMACDAQVLLSRYWRIATDAT